MINNINVLDISINRNNSTIDKDELYKVNKLYRINNIIREIGKLRTKVWNDEMVNDELFPKGWVDELDFRSLHFFKREKINNKDIVVGAGRLTICPLKFIPFGYKLIDNILPVNPFDPLIVKYYSRLVVDPDFRNKGIATDIIMKRLAYESKCDYEIMLSNNLSVIEYYKHFGFTNRGQIEVNYHHKTMPHKINLLIKTNK